MKNYECRICGCTLDPGEGLLCYECREKADKIAEENKKLHEKNQFSQSYDRCTNALQHIGDRKDKFKNEI